VTTADLFEALDVHLPFVFILLGEERIVDARMIEHGGIKNRVGAEHAALRQGVGAVTILDNENLERFAHFHAPCRAARNQQVVAIPERQAAVVAVQLAAALVDKQQIVTVAVAHQVPHVAVEAPETHGHIAVASSGVCTNGDSSGLSGGSGRRRADGADPSQSIQAVGG
jgi:putative Ca2+/H+ antiporter (TMEM165/GDT1 family)